ncbi:Spiroplasmavirus-related protein [Spiroplasma kunkelii CR2-3x]|uniref:Spiroplasmavirus-related protein n=1 Tax=Spiroplasma kunkelii CR2-3x TaxID=273035 RepID=A0A0K2JGI4_SPIKU|nr:Spiroplasmavirus-related protein [Spiroplasma kunkelii CR2-3x]
MFLKKNGKQNISAIAKCLNRHRSTILREIKRFKTINEYSAYKSDKMYYEKRKKNNKICNFTEEQINFMKIRLNKYCDSPKEFIYRYFLKFGVKFSVFVKTLYKWICLGFYGFLKQNLRYHGKKFKTKGKKDNRGKLTNFKSIWNLIGKIKGVITDRGKEFSKWREMEIFAETQVYFCDAG